MVLFQKKNREKYYCFITPVLLSIEGKVGAPFSSKNNINALVGIKPTYRQIYSQVYKRLRGKMTNFHDAICYLAYVIDIKSPSRSRSNVFFCNNDTYLYLHINLNKLLKFINQ